MADPQPLPRISAAEARALGSEALRERKEANDAYIRHIDANGAPPHVIEKHARAEAAASVALELELAHLERKYLTVKTQLEDLERLRVAFSENGSGGRPRSAPSSSYSSGGGSSSGGASADVANYFDPDINTVFAAMRRVSAYDRSEMAKSQEDYNAQRYGVATKAPAPSAPEKEKMAHKLYLRVQELVQENQAFPTAEDSILAVAKADDEIRKERSKLDEAKQTVEDTNEYMDGELQQQIQNNFCDMFQGNDDSDGNGNNTGSTLDVNIDLDSSKGPGTEEGDGGPVAMDDGDDDAIVGEMPEDTLAKARSA